MRSGLTIALMGPMIELTDLDRSAPDKSGLDRVRRGLVPVLVLFAALGSGIAAGALLSPQVTTLAEWLCPVGDSYSRCPPLLHHLLGPRLWTGIAAFLLLLVAAAAIALIGALIEWLEADSATPDRIGRAHLPPVVAAAAVLFAALGTGIAAAVLLGTHTRILRTVSPPLGSKLPLSGPGEIDALNPNLMAGVAAFVLVLAVSLAISAALPTFRRRR